MIVIDYVLHRDRCRWCQPLTPCPRGMQILRTGNAQLIAALNALPLHSRWGRV